MAAFRKRTYNGTKSFRNSFAHSSQSSSKSHFTAGHLPVTVQPTRADVAIARAIARNTKPAPEEIARVLTWGANEKVLLVLAAAGWLGRVGAASTAARR